MKRRLIILFLVCSGGKKQKELHFSFFAVERPQPNSTGRRMALR